MKKQNLVIMFDLDGTLLDTNELIFQSFIHTFKHYMPEKKLTQEELISFLGPTLHDSFNRYFDKNLIKELIEFYRAYNHAHHLDYVTIYPKVIETLDYLKKQGYHLAIITTKANFVAKIGLDLFDLSKYFDLIIGMDDVNKPKPNPEGILKTLEYFNQTKGIFIGDSDTDILAGQQANIYTVGVTWTMKPVETLTSLKPNLMISSIDQLIPYIKKLEVETNE
jgi:haloacid dehalogenase superfamily, subfamily IA, variant 3 with third motif having DD or ED/haloacid dehalogenase superfamily, subfamily IA, variant 1 with third motif having Dx(3-4)D or Dx(3-4)E